MLNESKIISFLTILNEKLIDELFDLFSREDRRKINRKKSLETKLKLILDEQNMYLEFMHNLHNKYKDKIEFDDNIDYSDMIKKLKKDDFIETSIYILYRSAIDDKFNKLYLKEYLNSDYFKECLETKKEINNRIEDELSKYVGLISFQNNYYYNFYPLYKIKNGELLKIENINESFPDYGNINLEGLINNYTSEYFHPIEKYYNDKCIYILEFDPDRELIKIDKGNSSGQSTKYKINTLNLLNNGRLTDINKSRIYKVVTLDDVHVDFTNNRFDITEKFLYCGEKALLKYENCLYGPYEVDFDKENYVYFLKNDTRINHIIKRYPINNKNEINIKTLPLYNSGDAISLAYLNSKCIDEQIDIIKDDELLDEIKKIILDKKEISNKSNIDKLIDLYRNSAFIGNDINKDVREGRIKKIENLLINLKDTDYGVEKIIGNISSLLNEIILNHNENEDSYYTNIIENITSSPNVMLKLQNTKIAKTKLDDLNKEYELRKRQIQELDDRIEAQKSNEETISIDNLIGDKKNKIEELDSIIQNKNNEITRLISNLDDIKKVEDITSKLSHLQETVAYNERRKMDLNSNIKDIEKELQKKLDSKAENAVNYCFDGMLTNKMLQKAYEWEMNEKENKLAHYIEKLNSVKKLDIEGEGLIQYIIDYVKRYREYDRNSIVNILICITQGFLTVFSGQPGTGKTTICKIIAAALGLNMKEHGKDMERFISLSVERGWTSKRDFIGYYNPLTKKYDKSNCEVFSGLERLNFERNHSEIPFIILLDEANLSPMEYYWADFMSLCDERDEYSSINLGEDHSLFIPDSLRFLATINNDHTTEVLSPRLLDRAWIINLPEVVDTNFDKLILDYTNNPILWECMKKTFGRNKDENIKMSTEVNEILDKIKRLYRNNNIFINPRTYNAILNYWVVAQKLFNNDKNGTDKTIVALDFAISQRLLPKLNGSGKEYSDFIQSLLDICIKNNLLKSSQILNNIYKKGKEMNYFQFFM